MINSTAERERAESTQSRRLWSLWDMLEMNAAKFVQILHMLDDSERSLRSTPGAIPDEFGSVPADPLRRICESLNLPISANMTEYIRNARTGREISEAMRNLKRSIHSELFNRTFLEPDAKFQKYFKNPELFGPDVFQAFPSANDDIAEAGMCLALERATACVMHLNRVCEAGLKALAKAVGIQPQNDWGSYIRKIHEELEKRAKTSGARSADEQFYAEAAIVFDHLKRAWRNPAMHVDKSYSTERAEEILAAVKSFMKHLATRISE